MEHEIHFYDLLFDDIQSLLGLIFYYALDGGHLTLAGMAIGVHLEGNLGHRHQSDGDVVAVVAAGGMDGEDGDVHSFHLMRLVGHSTS